MPLLMQDDQLVGSIVGQDGAMHNNTFSMQQMTLHSGKFDRAA
jgi:hypothetical protein